MRRTGIDLSAARCTLVDASVVSRWRTHGDRSSLRVHNFDILGKAESVDALTAELKQLADSGEFPRHAWVVLWDVRSTHQYLHVRPDRLKDAESIARERGAHVMDLEIRDVSVAVAEGPRPEDPLAKVELSFFAAASGDIQVRLRAVQNAGFIIDGISTPCGALWAQARLRRPSVPGAVHAYVALGASVSAVAIVSNGFLLYAKDLQRGFADAESLSSVSAREDFANWLARELRQSFLYVKQYWEDDVSQLLLCGDMPDIRSLTAPLIERLDIEVETLDSLDGIDTTALPEPVDRFAEQVASMRLASAVAAEPPPVNLLSVGDPAIQSTPGLGRFVLAGAAAAAIAFAAFLYTREGARVENGQPAAGAPQRSISGQDRTLPAQAERSSGAAISSQRPPPDAASDPSAGLKASSTTNNASPATGVEPTFRSARRAVAVRPGPAPGPLVRTSPQPTEPDPIVHAILFSSQQKSALVGNRVVRPGDPWGSGTVQSIEADAVVLVSGTGQVRRLPLDRPKSGAANESGVSKR